jgi:phosphopantothenoylcysteine decarboxylase/phosphopantothenate--cysteine ligase
MEENMLEHPATQEGIAKLKERGVTFVESQFGRLASGKIGKGRMAEVDEIVVAIRKVLARSGDFANTRVVVTAGGTQEPIDPVRFIGNRSSGKMGFALAEAARDRGAEVNLILGPTYLYPPRGINVISVETALDMKNAVERALEDADVLIMAAAVADFRVAEPSGGKIKREKLERLDIHLVKNPDILAGISNERLFKVGFAAESENMVENARGKLRRKQVHLFVANDITAPQSGFGVDTNKVTLIDFTGDETELPLMSKRAVADEVLNRVHQLKSLASSIKPMGAESPVSEPSS